MARVRLAGLAIVAAVTLSAGCGGFGASGQSADGRPPASEHPRDEDIRATLDALWAAVGIDTSALTVGEYGYRFAPDSTSCADLDREDRWYGFRGSLLPGGVIDQQGLESAIVSLLESERFVVERYRSTHPLSGARAFRAVQGELVVFGHLGPEGAADVNVRSGPCAPGSTQLDPDLYQPEG